MDNPQQDTQFEDPTGGVARFTVRTDRPLGRARARSLRYLKIDLQAVTLPSQGERRAVQVAFALDRSGSMGGDKMQLAREAVIAAVQRLTANDRFAVTVFDDRVELVQALAAATQEHVQRARTALSRVDARGSTALHDGWAEACGQIRRDAAGDTVNRCILVTDGQANRGPSDPATLSDLARRMRQEGVATTTLGIGRDFHEELLASMSKAGGGQFYYVQHPRQLDAILQSEIGEAMEVRARGVTVELWPSPGVRLDLLSDYPCGWTGTCLRVEVGDLVDAQHLELCVSARLPAGAEGDEASVEVRVGDREGPLALPVSLTTWRLADHATNDRQVRDFEVLRPVARILAARALLGVLGYNRSGSFGALQARLDEAIRRLRVLGEHDPEIAAEIAHLTQERRHMSRHVDESELKMRHMHGTSMSRGKSLDGRSRKSFEDLN